MPQLEEFTRQIYSAKGRAEQLSETIQSISQRRDSQTIELDAVEKAQVLFQTVAQQTQEKLRFHIEDIVQSALDTCYPGRYEFKVIFEIKRGKTEARIILDREGQELPPQDATGGGIVDLISFSLRLAAWSLSKTDPLIILDEPWKWLSVNLRPLAGEILKGLSTKMGLQIVMVTHDEEMINAADRVFNVKQRAGKSIITVD